MNAKRCTTRLLLQLRRLPDAEPAFARSSSLARILRCRLAQLGRCRGATPAAAPGVVAQVFVSGIGEAIYPGAFADDAASLPEKKVMGFAPGHECALLATPQGAELLPVDTQLTRDAFEACRT